MGSNEVRLPEEISLPPNVTVRLHIVQLNFDLNHNMSSKFINPVVAIGATPLGNI